MIARQLEGSDAPLKDDQRKRLLAVLTEERARVPMPEFNASADQQQRAKAANEWQADYDQRANAQARSTSTPNSTTRTPSTSSGNGKCARNSRPRGPCRCAAPAPAGTWSCAAPGRHLGAAVTVPAPPPENQKRNVTRLTADEQQIRDLVATWMSATRAGDHRTVLGLMTDDVVFLVAGQAPFGKREFAAAMRPPASGVPLPKIDGHSEIREITDVRRPRLHVDATFRRSHADWRRYAEKRAGQR